VRAVLSIVGCILSYAFLTAAPVIAGDWSSVAPYVHYSQPVLFNWSPYCPTYYQSVNVKDIGVQVPACVYEGEKLSIAVTTGSHGTPRAVVRYSSSREFHGLEGVCSTISCIYMPNSDTLIARFYTASPHLGVRVYKNVSQRIQRIADPVTSAVRFVFDSSQPDFTLSYDNGTPLAVEGIASSENGKWAAIEYREFGIIVVNLETFDTRRVLAQGMKYGFGFDPSVEMALSNDGRTLAVMGERTGFTVIQITPDCGDAVRMEMGRLFADEVVRCPLAPIDMNLVASSYRTMYDPEFNQTGTQLSFVVRLGDETTRYIRLRLPGFETVSLEYLGMGDSFSSGEGETEDGRYLTGTNETYEKCHTSNRSYPFLLGRLLSFSSTKNVACSGAKISDVVGVGSVYEGQGERLGAGGLGLSISARGYAQVEALQGFQPGMVLQEEFVERYEPRVATIGIGGNSAGVMTKLRTCAMPGLCEWVSIENRAKVRDEILGLFDQLAGMYRRLKQLSPSTAFLAIGYPRIIQPDGICDVITGVLFERREREFIDETLQLLNHTVRAAAEYEAIQFVDTEQSLEGHQLCSGSRTPAMNGLRLGDDMPIIGPWRLIGSETFHPTPFGHELIARTIQQVYMEGNSLGATMSGYWGSEHAEESLAEGSFLSTIHVAHNSTPIEIVLPDNTVTPSSNIDIRLGGSVQRHLKTVAADGHGAVKDTLVLPTDLAEGFYTIHLAFTSYMNERVDLYQELSIGKEVRDEGLLLRDDEVRVEEVQGAGDVPRGVVEPQGNNVKSSQAVLGDTSEGVLTDSQTFYPLYIIAGGVLGIGGCSWLILRYRRSRHPP
jgi:hypothetical protein